MDKTDRIGDLSMPEENVSKSSNTSQKVKITGRDKEASEQG